MREQFLRWALKKHLEAQGFKVQYGRIRIGNFEIDGEATDQNGTRMAIEIKTEHDDVCRGIGQLAEALAYGYNQATLVTTLRKARKLNGRVFEKFRIRLIGIDGRGNVYELLEF